MLQDIWLLRADLLKQVIGQWFLAKSRRNLDKLNCVLLNPYLLVEGMSKGKGKAPAAVVHKRTRKGKTIYSCERSCAAWKKHVTPAPVNASWQLAFKCVHTVTNVAKLENACAKSETVLFAPKNVSELDEGCAFLLGQPAAKVSIAFLEDDPDWKKALFETWFPKCVFQNFETFMRPNGEKCTVRYMLH